MTLAATLLAGTSFAQTTPGTTAPGTPGNTAPGATSVTPMPGVSSSTGTTPDTGLVGRNTGYCGHASCSVKTNVEAIHIQLHGANIGCYGVTCSLAHCSDVFWRWCCSYGNLRSLGFSSAEQFFAGFFDKTEHAHDGSNQKLMRYDV